MIRRSFCLLLASLSLIVSLVAESAPSDFQPFTGKITRNRVRMRTGPDLNSPIIREFQQGDLVAIQGEAEGFYAVEPPKDIKAYIHHRYILNNTVDGAHVNVRLEPSLEAPIIAQLNTGDRAEGRLVEQNGRWIEIALPQTVRFFIAKDFVEKAGPVGMLRAAEQRRHTAHQRIEEAYARGQKELEKPFEQIQLTASLEELKKTGRDYTDLPQEVARAKNCLAVLNESYEQRKQGTVATESSQTDQEEAPIRDYMVAWLPKEAKLYEEWLESHPSDSMQDFYAKQRADAVQLRGLVQPYARPIKNRPGNFMLVGHEDRQPIGFLYSTQVDLQAQVGKTVTLVALQRPNNQFALPTFFVLSAE